MSALFDRTDIDGDSLRVEGPTGPLDLPCVMVSSTEGWLAASFYHADAPALALAILEAAGFTTSNTSADTPEWSIGSAVAELKVAIRRQGETESAAARDKRRDELAKDLSNCGYDYLGAAPILRRAIDRIIELEASK